MGLAPGYLVGSPILSIYLTQVSNQSLSVMAMYLNVESEVSRLSYNIRNVVAVSFVTKCSSSVFRHKM